MYKRITPTRKCKTVIETIKKKSQSSRNIPKPPQTVKKRNKAPNPKKKDRQTTYKGYLPESQSSKNIPKPPQTVKKRKKAPNQDKKDKQTPCIGFLPDSEKEKRHVFGVSTQNATEAFLKNPAPCVEFDVLPSRTINSDGSGKSVDIQTSINITRYNIPVNTNITYKLSLEYGK
nr:MAG: hypothetical protein [Marsupenaeus japonicus endogenous nimavirus]